MKIHIFVQARLGSTRLKNKILKDVINKTSAIKFLNDRLKKIKSVDKIVYLIPAKDKHKLSRIIKEFDGSFFCGSETNVLSRYYNAAKKYKSDVIIRITSDCILSDPKMISKMIDIFHRKKLITLQTIIHLLFLMALMLKFSTLNFKKVFFRAKSNLDKEHVTLYLKNNFIKVQIKKIFSIKSISLNYDALLITRRIFMCLKK